MQNEYQEFDYLFKIVLIGDSLVGKSNILSRYTKNVFIQTSKTTVGVEFASKKIMIPDTKKNLKIQIWDTAGQQRFRAISKAYYRGAVGALLVYDITNQTTFENLKKWIQQLSNNLLEGQYTINNELVIMLVGNKLDRQDERAVRKEKAIEFAQKYKFAFMETSAKTGMNINEAFNMLVECKLQLLEIYKVMIKSSILASVSQGHKNKDEQKKQQIDNKSNLILKSQDNSSCHKKKCC